MIGWKKREVFTLSHTGNIMNISRYFIIIILVSLSIFAGNVLSYIHASLAAVEG